MYPNLVSFYLYFYLDNDESLSVEADNLSTLLMFGGMDTQGEIFNDCLVLLPVAGQ